MTFKVTDPDKLGCAKCHGSNPDSHESNPLNSRLCWWETLDITESALSTNVNSEEAVDLIVSSAVAGKNANGDDEDDDDWEEDDSEDDDSDDKPTTSAAVSKKNA